MRYKGLGSMQFVPYARPGSSLRPWEMSLLNRQRLVRTLIKEIQINEPACKVNVVLWKSEDNAENQRKVGS